jgi:hypothetical protein
VLKFKRKFRRRGVKFVTAGKGIEGAAETVIRENVCKLCKGTGEYLEIPDQILHMFSTDIE